MSNASTFCSYKPCRKESLIVDGMYTNNSKLRQYYAEFQDRDELPNLFFCSDTCCAMRKHECGIEGCVLPHDLYNRLLREIYGQKIEN